MKIYLDFIFFENFIVNAVLSMQINYFTKQKSKKISMIIGIVFISFYTTLVHTLKYNFLDNIVIKIISIIIYVYITFKPKTFIKLVKLVIYYLFFMFAYIGSIISITLLFKIDLQSILNRIIVYSISAIAIYIFTKYLWKMWKSNIKNNDLMYIVCIGGKKITSFVDTGNSVKDILNNLDVLFVDSKYKKDLVYYLNKSNKVNLNINTISNSTVQEGYIFRNICVYKNNKYINCIKKIIVCFVENNFDNKEYGALLGYNTYIENLKGVMYC